MVILGIDYGSSKIGLAKSDSEKSFALPLEILSNTSKADVLKRIKDVIAENDVEKVVVGVPISLAGETGEVDLVNQQMQEVLTFVEWLTGNIDVPVVTEDERLSTKMANTLNKGMMKNGSDDDVAAMLILQTHLDKLE